MNDAAPFRKPFDGYASCGFGPVMNHRRSGQVKKIYKNTTAVTGGAVDANGVSTIEGLLTSGTGPTYDGTNYGASGLKGPWTTPRVNDGTKATLPVNTFAEPKEALLGVTIVDPGSGYPEGAVMTIPGGTTDSGWDVLDLVSTFQIHVDGTGAILSTYNIIPGCRSSSITAQTTAIPDPPGGSGAVFAYTRQDATIDFGKCAQVGWKQIWARRNWHGIFGFLAPESADDWSDGVCDYLVTDSNDVAPGDPGYIPTYDSKFWRSYQSAPTVQKYARMDISINMTQAATQTMVVKDSGGTTISTAVGAYSGECQNDCWFAVNPLSGELTQDANPLVVSSMLYNYHQSPSGGTDVTDDPDSGRGFQTIAHPCWGYKGWAANGTQFSFGAFNNLDGNPGRNGFTCAGGDNVFWSGFSGSKVAIEAAIAAYPSFFIDVSEITGNGFVPTVSIFDVSDTVFHVKITFAPGSVYNATNPSTGDTTQTTGAGSASYEFKVTLSEPVHYLDDVLADADGLLALWNILDDTLYPPKTNAFTGIEVLVARNEVPSNAVPGPGIGDNIVPDYSNPTASSGGFYTAWGTRPYFDPACYAWVYPGTADNNTAIGTLIQIIDGAVLGAPESTVPADGVPQNIFDFRYSGGTYGEWNAAMEYLPPRATHWTNGDQSSKLRIGRNVLYGGNSPDGAAWVSAYLETSARFPSYDHARPYGTDRSTLKATGCCLADAWQPGGTTVMGVCTPAIGSDQYRFPFCPPMAGRLAIASITLSGDGSYFTVVHAAMPAVNNIDHTGASGAYPLDFCGFGMAALATNVAPTYVSTSSFTVPTSSVAYATVAAAKWIVLYGALPADPAQTGVAHWYWQDTQGKGQGIYAEWLVDNRTAGEIARLSGQDSYSGSDCGTGTALYSPPSNNGFGACTLTDFNKGFIYCSKWSIVLSPCASHTPPTNMGVRLDFGTVQPLDEQYGSEQVADVIQAMSDPLYEQYSDCTGLIPPTCIPYVEARAILPHATGATVPPDNGAGAAQDEGSPSGGNFVNYTFITADMGGNAVYPPRSSADGGPDQPGVLLAPTGIYVPC